MSFSNPSIAFLAGVSALALPAVAAAQEATGEEDAEASNVIIVSAERRDQNLQTTALSVSAISGDDLDANQIGNVDDLIKAAPSVTVNDSGIGKSINIRGVGKNVDSPGVSAGVAFYVDGVPIPNSIFLNTPFFDLQRVEVLRGPQGTLVGMNSTGGAVLLVSNDPDPSAVEGMVEASYGNYDHVRLRGVLNTPIAGELAFRVAGEYESRDSFFTNVGPTDNEPGNLDRLALRAALGGEFSPDFEAFLRFEYSETNSDGLASKRIPGDQELVPPASMANVPLNLPIFNPPERFEIAKDVDTRNDGDYWRIGANINIALSDGIELRSVTGYQDGSRRLLNDVDNSSFGFTRAQIDIDETAFSQELNLISTSDGPLDWVVGAFYLDLETTGFVEPFSLILGNPISRVFGVSKTENWGVFGQGTLALSEATNLTVGLRYNDETASNPGGFVQLFNPVTGDLVAEVPEFVGEVKSTEVTGRVTLDHQFSDEHFGFLTVSKGFKGGGTGTAFLPGFDPETVWNYEAGLKSEFADGQLRTQLGVFYMDFSDIQRNIFSTITNSSDGVGNFASAEIYGLEFEAQGQIGDLGLDLAVSFTESKLGTTSLIDDRFGSLTPLDLTGNSLPFNPKWIVSLGAHYDIYLSDDIVLTPRARLSHNSDQFANEFQAPIDLIEAYTLVDASLRLENEQQGWYGELYGTNLFDEEWDAARSTLSNVGGRAVFYGAPRQYGIRVGMRF